MRAAVEQLRLTPIMFELGARPHPAQALYRSYLAQSDVFVGIYWQRYGWVAPDMQISGLEDELVLSQSMPRLVYVKRPAPEIEPRLAEMLGRLEGDSGLSYKSFGDVDELRDLLLDDLALLLTERFASAVDASSVEPAASNLPAPVSTFLGREAALHELGALLEDDRARLITLAGPGGTGKTRLAIEAVRTHEARRLEEAVFFVDLSAESQPDDAFAAIGRTMGIAGSPDGAPFDALVDHVRQRKVLLVLDSFERVITAGAAIVELLERCPGVKCLVTSREPLHTTGEHLFHVPPLSLPGASAVEDVLGSEAGQLFCERAGAVGAGFVLSDDNAADVAAICRRLDGLPLALELAAAQVRLFAPDELRERLAGKLEVLRDGPRDLPMRQRTLRATIEWSTALLTSAERRVFLQCSVFSSARLVDIEAALTGLPGDDDAPVFDSLSALVDKSLVQAVPGLDGRPRFTMLQTIREFAAEELDRDEASAVATRAAHAAHYTDLAIDRHRQITYADRASALAVLGEELGNLRAAWDHWVGGAEVSRLDDLLAPLWGYHEARGDYRAVIALGEDLLRVLSGLPESPERKHDELTLRTNLARMQLAVRGFTPEAEQAMCDALDRFAASKDGWHRFPALRSLATLHLMRSEFARTTVAASELMEIAQREADDALLSEAHLLAAISSNLTGDLSLAIEHADRAVSHFDASSSGFVEFRVGPNPGVVANVVSGLLRWPAGLADGAVTNLERAVQLAIDLDHPYSVAYALHHATVLDHWRSDFSSVATRSEASLALATTHDYPVWRALAMVLHGTATLAAGSVDDGLTEIEQGFALYRGLSTPPVFWPYLLMIRAHAYGMSGQLDRALATLDEADASLQASDPLRDNVAIARGDLLLAAPSPDRVGAEALFALAATSASRRDARMVELEARTRLARAGGDDALERLRSLYATFTQGFDTPQLAAARALLGDDGA